MVVLCTIMVIPVYVLQITSKKKKQKPTRFCLVGDILPMRKFQTPEQNCGIDYSSTTTLVIWKCLSRTPGQCMLLHTYAAKQKEMKDQRFLMPAYVDFNRAAAAEALLI